MTKSEVYQKELEKLQEIFKDVEDNKAKLVEGLVEEAAFLKAENHGLKLVIEEIGMIIFNPKNKIHQRTPETSKQYLKNINSYAVVIKTLNGVLMKNEIEPDDEFDTFMKEMKENE